MSGVNTQQSPMNITIYAHRVKKNGREITCVCLWCGIASIHNSTRDFVVYIYTLHRIACNNWCIYDVTNHIWKSIHMRSSARDFFSFQSTVDNVCVMCVNVAWL